jgi:predicted nicotinamide N-methyase
VSVGGQVASGTEPLPLVFGQPLAVQAPPLCPEIRLWLLDGQVDLNAQIDPIFKGESIPFWAFCWGAGQALARYILDHPRTVAGKRVVDFGAGSGVAAIAAARAGALRACAVDIDPTAQRMALNNARLNGVGIEVSGRLPETWGLLLAGDVLYEDETCRWLLTLSRGGRQVVVSNPERQDMPRLERLLGQAGDRSAALVPLCRVESPTFPDVDYPTRYVAIYGSPSLAYPPGGVIGVEATRGVVI